MSTIKNSNKKNKDIPQNKKVAKPWGSEYSIYRNKISSAKLLKLNTNQKTSLHCHPTKKTGFILLDGKVDVEVGFYEKKKNEINFKTNDQTRTISLYKKCL